MKRHTQRARPDLSSTRRASTLTLQLTSEEREKIEKDAAACGLKAPQYLKTLALGELQGRQQGAPAENAFQLRENELGLLKRIELLALLTESEVLQVINKLQVRNFRKNEIVLVEEDSNDFMYVILEGEVKVTRTSEDGKEIILALHAAGDFFGEMSLIDGQMTSATVTAIEESLIALISKEDFYSLLYNEKKILLSLLQSFCRRIRASNKTIEILSYTNAQQRIKALFRVLAGKYGVESGEGTVLNIQIAHRDIAGMTGLTRETVTKIMTELRDEGCISILADKFIRLNNRFAGSWTQRRKT
ncbi:MAG TPA: Crp/Fnr family transcriptional regulator [Dissulfurispiraceae bacterium]